jgi:hypothetical protein
MLSVSYSMTCRSTIAAGSISTSSSSRSCGQDEAAGVLREMSPAVTLTMNRLLAIPSPPSRIDELHCRRIDYLTRRCRFVSRTPAPPPFSAINSTPASSRLAMRAYPVSARPPMSPSEASSLLTVGADTRSIAQGPPETSQPAPWWMGGSR